MKWSAYVFAIVLLSACGSGQQRPRPSVEPKASTAEAQASTVAAQAAETMSIDASCMFSEDACEKKDWGIAPTSVPRKSEFHSPTPLTVPGAYTITTEELRLLLRSSKQTVVIDVAGGSTRRSIPGAVWLPALSSSNPKSPEVLSTALLQLTSGDKSRPVVLLCLSSQCWLSYNATLNVIRAGYKTVNWYRGGTEAWEATNLPTKQCQKVHSIEDVLARKSCSGE